MLDLGGVFLEVVEIPVGVDVDALGGGTQGEAEGALTAKVEPRQDTRLLERGEDKVIPAQDLLPGPAVLLGDERAGGRLIE
jgi:hypothetical protein